MKAPNLQKGLDELRAARRESRFLFWAAGLFSAFVNLLMLTGPLYMLQVYDRVLGSRSVATLVALTLLVVFLYTMMGLLDYARGRIMARVGARFQSRLDKRVFDAVIRKNALGVRDESALALRDLEAVQRLLTSPALMALFDLPFTPLFIFGIFLFHPWLGILSLIGGAILVTITLSNQLTTRRPLIRANRAVAKAEIMSEQLRSEAEMIQAMGMREAAFQRWQKARAASLEEHLHAADLGGTFSTAGKTFRLLLQSAMLGLGAYLVLQAELTPGAMIAGSILMGRALAPIEMSIGQWPLFARARKGWQTLAQLLSEVPPEAARMPLPRPQASLEVSQATVVPPGESQASLKMVNFTVKPGQAVGVIGKSGSGKSTLARALTGAWRPAGGKIRLDNAALDQYDPSVLGELIGYLPQRVELFDGTIAENIARLSPTPDAPAVVAAAKRADAHAMIVKLPDGYDTKVSTNGGRLSGGQIQRIGLARAMYGDPVLLILDEPNSNLDNDGSQALNRAIAAFRTEGKSVLIMAHRPAAIEECDMLLMLEDGRALAYGPKEEVLRRMVQNHAEIGKNAGKGGSITGDNKP
ncbi:type I secretion system permease/ATPase [Lentibacter sp. XHP0401]|uniref:type I secretion system permease/ATPase n=1 Tax=Lentibacter sp. XHP0401 TaxID=2984334 RepID=UPI0021E82B51|nr:type I secretion system permease/ATPase [Lentibacter sp. XHP0401]MCV2893091.1 type I secretion system permease/ATPase [Lentibacter sp. XHP0401]